MRLYDNDAYREDFVTGVYDVLSSDPTWDRANQIIQLFDNAPVAEEPPNEPLTLEELREMDGEPVYVTFPQCSEADGWMLVNVNRNCVYDGYLGCVDFELCGETWLAYRRKPEKEIHERSDK